VRIWRAYWAPIFGAILIGVWVGLQAAHYLAPDAPERRFQGQGSLPRVYTVGNWQKLELTTGEKEQYLQILETLPVSMEGILKELAPVLTVSTDTSKCPKSGEGACAVIKQSYYSDGSQKLDEFALYLPSDSFDGSNAGSYLILHELAHAIDHMGLSDKQVAGLLRSRPDWQEEWAKVRDRERDGYTLTLEEMWAEQWAMWAMEGKSLSVYGAPRLGKTDGRWGYQIAKSFRPTFPRTKFSRVIVE
jgi:hypothetical protein